VIEAHFKVLSSHLSRSTEATLKDLEIVDPDSGSGHLKTLNKMRNPPQ